MRPRKRAWMEHGLNMHDGGAAGPLPRASAGASVTVGAGSLRMSWGATRRRWGRRNGANERNDDNVPYPVPLASMRLSLKPKIVAVSAACIIR